MLTEPHAMNMLTRETICHKENEHLNELMLPRA